VRTEPVIELLFLRPTLFFVAILAISPFLGLHTVCLPFAFLARCQTLIFITAYARRW